MAQIPLHPVVLAGLTGAAAFALLGANRPRSRSEWLERFASWAGPASDTEDERVTRTGMMVRGVLETSQFLSRYAPTCIAHGSSANNTNIKRNSDLDLIAMCEEPWSLAWPGESLPFTPSGRPFLDVFVQYANDLQSAFREKFGAFGVGRGQKCLKLTQPTSTRVACDILPAFRLRQYLPRADWPRVNSGNPSWREGVIFLTASGRQIVSYPEQHLANGRQKNIATGYRYKQVVRIVKKLKADFDAEQTILTREPLPSSFEIESSIYNVPNGVLVEGDLFDAVGNSLQWLSGQLGVPNRCNALAKVDGIHRLLPEWRAAANTLLQAEPPSELLRLRRFVEHASSILSKRS